MGGASLLPSAPPGSGPSRPPLAEQLKLDKVAQFSLEKRSNEKSPPLKPSGNFLVDVVFLVHFQNNELLGRGKQCRGNVSL